MTSHIDEAVQARIAAVAAKTQQRKEEREAFSRRRAEGLKARKRQKLRTLATTDVDGLRGAEGHAAEPSRGDIPTVAEERP